MLSYRETDHKAFLKALRYVRKEFPKDYSQATLLDIGCWNGDFTVQIRDELGVSKDRVFGIEADKDQHADSYGGIEAGANEVKVAKSKGIQVHETDLNKPLPFADKSFDVVTANQVLEHVWNVDALLLEIKRVLKDDGVFVVGVPNFAALHERVSLLFGYNPSTWHTAGIQIGLRKGACTGGRCHVNGFTVDGFSYLLKHYGFKRMKKFMTEVYFATNYYIPWLSRVFPNFALSQVHVVVK